MCKLSLSKVEEGVPVGGGSSLPNGWLANTMQTCLQIVNERLVVPSAEIGTPPSSTAEAVESTSSSRGGISIFIYLLLQHLKIPVGELGEHDGGDAAHFHHHAFLAFVLHFYESALDTIETTADDSHTGALGEVYLIGGEIDQAVVVALAHSDELLHLSVGDYDGHSAAIGITSMILKVIHSAFQLLDALFGGVSEYQVLYGGDKLSCFVIASVCYDGPPHGDETLHILAFEVLLCFQFATKGGAHGKPGEIDRGSGCIFKGGHFRVGTFLWLLETVVSTYVSSDYSVSEYFWLQFSCCGNRYIS